MRHRDAPQRERDAKDGITNHVAQQAYSIASNPAVKK